MQNFELNLHYAALERSMTRRFGNFPPIYEVKTLEPCVTNLSEKATTCDTDLVYILLVELSSQQNSGVW